MDPGTELILRGTVKIVEKILGPTADYLGDGLKSWTEKGAKNIGRIFRNAESRLGDSINKPGAVPPRILKEILDVGQFCDDELTAEYLGGVLASSRTLFGSDDRGITFLALTSQLSSFQIRFHYICYSFWHQRFQTNWLRSSFGDQLEIMTTALTYDFLSRNMGIYDPEKFHSLCLHSAIGLARLGLIENLVEGLTLDFNNFAREKGWSLPEGTDFIIRPTTFGGEYYICGTGNGTSLLWNEIPLPIDLPGTNLIQLKNNPVLLSLK